MSNFSAKPLDQKIVNRFLTCIVLQSCYLLSVIITLDQYNSFINNRLSYDMKMVYFDFHTLCYMNCILAHDLHDKQKSPYIRALEIHHKDYYNR